MIAAIDLDEGLAALAVELGALASDAHAKLNAYLALLAKWNRTYNLTAIRDPEQMVTHHVLDALAVLPHLPDRDSLRMLDVGSGGGVPGLPLAIARPRWSVVLLDSNSKKAAFLQQAVIELGLANVKVATTRVEDYAPAQPFDVVISRAFADLATFVHSSARHASRAGHLYAMKGVFPEEEIAHLPATARVVATPSLIVPGLTAQRHLIVLQHTDAEGGT